VSNMLDDELVAPAPADRRLASVSATTASYRSACLLVSCGTANSRVILDRPQLALVPTPPGTATHRPIPHHEVVNALVETLGFRHIGVVSERYAVDKTGMKMFGALDLDTAEHDFRFSIGIRNSHDKSMRLALTVGYKVFVCDNMAFSGDFEPVLAKHSKHFNLVESISVGVDQMQRNFKPMVEQVDR
jgi:hypothetical protein